MLRTKKEKQILCDCGVTALPHLVVCAELVMLLEWWSGTECTLYTDQATVDKFGKEHVIIILNHNFEIDFLCGWTMCERYGVLGVRGLLELCFLPSLCSWLCF